jgi:protein SCO1
VKVKSQFKRRAAWPECRAQRHTRQWRAIAVFCAAVILSPALARAQHSARTTTLPPILQDVGIDQKLNNQVPLDLVFRDENGKTVRLGDYFGKKPVVLDLVYFTCPMLCGIVEHGLETTLHQLRFSVGDQFNVLTVSFDPRDTPEEAAKKKALYVGMYNRPGAAQGWHWLTGDEASIRALTSAVGFRYNYDPKTGQYYHATGIMVLTPEGKLSRYFYGIHYPAGDLRLALVEASNHKIGSPVDVVLLYCCQYNVATGRYSVVIMHVIALAGAVTILSLGTLFMMLFWGGRKKREKKNA